MGDLELTAMCEAYNTEAYLIDGFGLKEVFNKGEKHKIIIYFGHHGHFDWVKATVTREWTETAIPCKIQGRRGGATGDRTTTRGAKAGTDNKKAAVGATNSHLGGQPPAGPANGTAGAL